MEAIDRRSALRGMLCVVVAAGCSTSLLPTDAKAVPLAQSKDAAAAAPAHNLKQPAQAVTSRPLSSGTNRALSIRTYSRSFNVCSTEA